MQAPKPPGDEHSGRALRVMEMKISFFFIRMSKLIANAIDTAID